MHSQWKFLLPLKKQILLYLRFGSIDQRVAEKIAMELQGKIIVDPSNPIAPDDKGGSKKIIGEKESAGEIFSLLLPNDAKLAKAFGTLSAASLASAAFQKPEAAVSLSSE